MKRLLLTLLALTTLYAAAPLSQIGSVRVNTDTTGTNTTAANVIITNLSGTTPRTGVMMRDARVTNAVDVGSAGNAGLVAITSASGLHTTRLMVDPSGTLIITNDATRTMTLQPNNGYAGAGANVLYDNGLFRPPANLTFDTVADMVAFTVPSHPTNLVAIVKGRVSVNDKGGGVFFYNSIAVTATNLGTVFKPVAAGGRWTRLFAEELSVSWFGADYTGANDSTVAIQATLDAAATFTGPAVFFPQGVFRTTNTLTTFRRGTFRGEGRSRSFVISTPTGAASTNSVFTIPTNSDNIRFEDLNLQNGLTSGSVLMSGILCEAGVSSSTHLYFARVNFEFFTQYGFYSDSSFYVQFDDCSFYRINNITAYGGTDTPGATAIKILANANNVIVQNSQFGINDQFIDLVQGHTALVEGNTFEGGGRVQRVGFTPGYFIDIANGGSFTAFNFLGNYIESAETATNRAVLRLQGIASPNINYNDWFGALGGTNLTHNFIEVGTNVFACAPTGNSFEDNIQEAISTPSTSWVWAWHNTFRRAGGTLTTKNEILPYVGDRVLLDGDDITFVDNNNVKGYNWFTASDQTNDIVYSRYMVTNTSGVGVVAGYGFGLDITLPRDTGSLAGVASLTWPFTQTAVGLEDIDFAVNLTRNSVLAEKFRIDSQGFITLNTTTRVLASTGTPEGAVTAPIGSLFMRTDGGSGTTLYTKTSGAGNTGWTALGTGSGTITGGENLGTGVGVYASTSVPNLQFNSLAGAAGITVSSNASTLTATLSVTNYVTIALGNPAATLTTGNTNYWRPIVACTLKSVNGSLLWWSTSGSVTLELKENGTTVLSAPVTLTAGSPGQTNVVGTLSDTAIAAGAALVGEVTGAGTDAYGAQLRIGYTIP